jgi:hypothetical protein
MAQHYNILRSSFMQNTNKLLSVSVSYHYFSCGASKESLKEELNCAQGLITISFPAGPYNNCTQICTMDMLNKQILSGRLNRTTYVLFY